ncbi:MAG: hypothetical protein PF518_06640 [Spirochaetaceae bacterium]|nr:hypothetical protein [Spirochaetaceae bacterium]
MDNDPIGNGEFWKKSSDFRSYLVETCDDVFSFSSSSTDLRENILSSKSGMITGQNSDQSVLKESGFRYEKREITP